MKLKKIALGLVIAAITLTGCSSGSDDSKEEIGAKKVKVSVPVGYVPFGYLDEDQNLQGYEIEVLKEVDKLLEDYEFEFSATSADVFSDIKTGKIDLAASQWYRTDEREKTYTMSDEAYTNFGTYIVYDGDKGATYDTLESLHGKKVAGYPQGAETYIVEKYNSENGDPIEIVYAKSTGDATIILKQLQNGTADATIAQDYTVNRWNSEFGTNIKASKEPVMVAGTYYLLKKGNTELKDAVDGAIKILRENGKLKKLSEEILGADYTQPLNAE